MQAIRYNVRQSSFYERIHDQVRATNNVSRPAHVELTPGGYLRDVRISILADDRHTFLSDWKYSDERFSARIRTAATVLRDRGAWGDYHVVHNNGELTLQRL